MGINKLAFRNKYRQHMVEILSGYDMVCTMDYFVCPECCETLYYEDFADVENFDFDCCPCCGLNFKQ